MIWLDQRAGSKELLPEFRPFDVDIKLCMLPFGDVAWYGQGEIDGEASSVAVGCEVKTISDLVQSMRSNRLSGHQLPGLFDNYQHVILLVEGIWQAGQQGEVVVRAGKQWIPLRVGSGTVSFREVDHYLATLEHKCGVVVKCTGTKAQTAAWLVSRYKWWNGKPWAKHDSDVAIYAPEPVDEKAVRRRGGWSRGTRRAGPVECVAAQLPGLDQKAWNVGKRFKTVADMVNAGVKEWTEVEGVGKKGAETIHKWLRGG